MGEDGPLYEIQDGVSMNKAGGYIALHRKIIDWEWYGDPVTRGVFLHLLIVANFTDAKFMGKKIKRGQFVTSLSELAKQTGFSIQQVKTALKHLISTNEITNQSSHQYRIITIVKYNDYQTPTNELTNDQQTTNKRLTNDQQQYNKNNKNNNGINKSLTRFIAPTLDEVVSYVNEIKSTVDPEYFFDHYESNGWTLKGGQKMRDWKATLRNWTRRENNGRTEQPGKNSGSSPENHGDKDPFLEQLKRTVHYV